MHDSQYREAIAWQNVGYNQPPNPSFFLGSGMAAAPTPNIYTVTYVPNAAPTAVTLSPQAIAENAGAGAIVGQLSTTDSNAGDTFTYTLVSGTGDTHNASFAIVGSQLTTAVSLDYEAGPTRSVRVRSTDAGGLVVEATFTITVADVMDDYVVTVATSQQVIDPVLPSGLFRLVKRGAGTLTFTRPNAYTGGTVTEAGIIVVRSTGALGSGGWDIHNGATITIDFATANAGISLPSLTMATSSPAAKLDIGTSQLTVAGGLTAGSLTNLIKSGRSDGSWLGEAGITSAAAAGGQLRAVGWRHLDGGSFAIGFAAAGDTNLDGTIDVLDAAAILGSGKLDTGFAADWADGDSNYDGVIDLLDIADFIGTGLFETGSYQAAAQAASASSAETVTPQTALTAMEMAFVAAAMQDASSAKKNTTRTR
jgi:autotransporter-associated beta strand protein